MRKRILIFIGIIIAVSTVLSLTIWKDNVISFFWIKHMEEDERISRMRVDQVIEKLNLESGQMIADIGAGSGLFSRLIAKKVVPDGKVFAIDIYRGNLEYIAKTAANEKIKNIKTVLAREKDPKIPELVDLVFICDVLHLIDGDQERYVKTMSSYLKNGGRIAVVSFKKNWPPMAKRFTGEDLKRWMIKSGLEKIHNYDFIEDQYLMIFKKK